MKTIRVNASTPYDIIIENGLLDSCGELCAKTVGARRVCIVSDDTVAALYLERAKCSLSSCGFDVLDYVFLHGESSKNTKTLIDILEFLAENRLSRTDCLIALGGGVVGDVCGFAASVYMRGIKFIQIPTTLLACVDSSVGGKTAVDLAAGKNLMGTFHQPSLVIVDPLLLNTLTPEIFADGCAEVIKYGVINDKAFFNSLFDGIKPQIENVIAVCVTNKAKLVEEDEFDNGARQLLNLGHTIGHAIELRSNFEISHGSAVAIGMVIVTKMAISLGICPPQDLESLCNLISATGLPTSCKFSARELASVATADKKRRGQSITLVLPHGIGNSQLYTIDVSELESYIQKGL